MQLTACIAIGTGRYVPSDSYFQVEALCVTLSGVIWRSTLNPVKEEKPQQILGVAYSICSH